MSEQNTNTKKKMLRVQLPSLRHLAFGSVTSYKSAKMHPYSSPLSPTKIPTKGEYVFFIYPRRKNEREIVSLLVYSRRRGVNPNNSEICYILHHRLLVLNSRPLFLLSFYTLRFYMYLNMNFSSAIDFLFFIFFCDFFTRWSLQKYRVCPFNYSFTERPYFLRTKMATFSPKRLSRTLVCRFQLSRFVTLFFFWSCKADPYLNSNVRLEMVGLRL